MHTVTSHTYITLTHAYRQTYTIYPYMCLAGVMILAEALPGTITLAGL